MGNNNATANLTEEESSKLEETNGMSPLESVSVETTQNQAVLEGEGKDGDKEKESFRDDGKIEKKTPEAEPQSKEFVEDPKVKDVEEEMYQRPSVMETDEKLQKQISVAEGVETVTEVEEQCLSMFGTQSDVSKLITTESGNDEKPCMVDEIVFVFPSSFETDESEEEKMIDESRNEIVPVEEVAKLDQDTGLEQRTGFAEIEPQEILNQEYCIFDESRSQIIPAEEVEKIDQETGQEQRTRFAEIEPQEILNLDYRSVDDDEGKANLVISSLDSSQEPDSIQETGLEVYKEEKYMETGRETYLKRMSRCRSLPVSHNSRAIGDSLVPQLVSEVAFPSKYKMANYTSETLLVPCVGSNKAQETSAGLTECNKEAKPEFASPSSCSDLRIEDASDELTQKTLFLCEDKSETYEATIDVEEKTVMLKRSETEETRGIEISLGFSLKHTERSEANDSFKETNGSRDDKLLDKKASLGSMKGRVRKRSKSSLLGTCLCCTTAMN